ncbi:helix-turn-helix transcriptional regulator [Clostridium botulinum]|nr:helix-turn-helix transcriptional regulator [Clostridium botulinum]
MKQDIIVNYTDGKIHNDNIVSFEEREKELRKIEKQEDNQREINDKLRKNSPFSNFYQFNRDYSKEMIWLAGKNSRAHQILLFLLDQMDNYNALMCSYKVIQEALDISESTAKRGIKLLKDHGFIAVYRSGSSNVYAVNKSLAWSSWGTNYKYAKFDAKIIISENEQEEIQIKQSKIKQIEIKEIE